MTMSNVTASRPWLALIGLGEDGRAGLTRAAEAALDAAEFIVGGARHLALVAPLDAETLAWSSPMQGAYPAILARRGTPVAVLATGDPFHYGVGADLAPLIPPAEMAVFPAPSAFSLAAARLGWSLPEVALVSVHGRALGRIVPHLQPGARVLALSSNGGTPGEVAALLRERGMGGSRLTVLERMGGPRERVRSSLAEGFGLDGIDTLNTLAVEVVAPPGARIVSLAAGRDDALYAHDGQLTKAEVRAVTLAALAPRAGELLWDVGAGAGSVGIEWCLAHPANAALGVEADPARAARAARNAAELGATALRLVTGTAPTALAGLPAPGAVFIGGGAGEPGVVEACWDALPPGGRLVINAVTLETEARLLALRATHGGQLIRLGVSRAEPVGGLHGWRPAMPLTQWRGVKP